MISRRFCHVIYLSAFMLYFSLLFAHGVAGAAFIQENKAENLKAFFELIYQTIHVKKNPKQAAALFQSLTPDQDRLKKGLKDDVAPEIGQKIIAMYNNFGLPNEANIGQLVPAECNVIEVYGASTEKIAKHLKGSFAYDYFPGGTQQVAERVLRPKLMFYQVKLLAPGETVGITYHLFYWDGQQWSMLGPIWRVLK
jgi:hypothetical protein